VNRFATADRLAAHAGLVPSYHRLGSKAYTGGLPQNRAAEPSLAVDASRPHRLGLRIHIGSAFMTRSKNGAEAKLP
jgi:transposase